MQGFSLATLNNDMETMFLKASGTITGQILSYSNTSLAYFPPHGPLLAMLVSLWHLLLHPCCSGHSPLSLVPTWDSSSLGQEVMP